MKSVFVAGVILIVAFAMLPTSLFIGAAGGLLVGWNLLEQPAKVKDAWTWVTSKIEELNS